MRLAYADPPYPGQAKRHYADHPDYAGEVDHSALVRDLEAFDGWALSTSAAALQDVLALCPPKTRVAVWYRPNSGKPYFGSRWYWTWEPVLIRPARPLRQIAEDHLTLSHQSGFMVNAITGQKPAIFCEWVFRLMGAEPGDTLADVFPGSGAVGRAWDRFASQLTLPAPLDKEKGEHLGSPVS